MLVTIWNRKRSRASLQNQQTRELISAWKSSHKRNNKDLSSIRWLPPGMWVNKRCVNSTRGTSKEEENVIFIVSRYVTVCCCQEVLRWKTSWSYLALFPALFQQSNLRRVFMFSLQVLHEIEGSGDQLTREVTAVLNRVLSIAEQILSWEFTPRHSILCHAWMEWSWL